MSMVLRSLALVSSMTVLLATEAAATEYQCRKRDSSLRIAIEVKKAGHTLPCEVVAQDDRGERAVLYSAQFDRDYCPSRIERTKEELEQEGWTCDKTSDENVVNVDGSFEPQQQTAALERQDTDDDDAVTADDDKVVAVSQQCRLEDELRHISIEVEDEALGKPCELIYWGDGDRSKPGELLWRAEHDATFCPRRLEVIVGKWVDEGWSCEAAEGELRTASIDPSKLTEAVITQDEPAEIDTVERTTLLEDDPTLQAVIVADAERIGEWMEVEPEIEVAARGDLNDDGSDDAVVFLTYQSEQAAYRQYLMSYLVDGDGYELASVKLLTGVSPPPAQARVEEIEKGVIWLNLPDPEGAASEPTGFRLSDEQLIEVAPDADGSSAN